MLDSSSPKRDRSELRIGYWLNSSKWWDANWNWKPNSCLIPTLSLDYLLTQPWEILSEATPSRAPEIGLTIKPKLLPWYEMMTTSGPNSDGGGASEGVRSHTIIIVITAYNYYQAQYRLHDNICASAQLWRSRLASWWLIVSESLELNQCCCYWYNDRVRLLSTKCRLVVCEMRIKNNCSRSIVGRGHSASRSTRWNISLLTTVCIHNIESDS